MDYDVLRLDVAVDDAVGVDLVDCFDNLFHDEGSARLWKW